jgi:hypothetical protein
MQPDPDYLRQRYSSLSDDALLAIDRSDLIEMAQRYYDAEVKKRKLALPSSVRRANGSHAVPRRSDNRSGELVKAGGKPPDTGERPPWLDEAAEVRSVDAGPGTGAADTATSARDVLEAAGIPCYLELIEITEEEKKLYQLPTHRWRLMVPANLNLRAISTLQRDIDNQEFEAVWKAQLEALSDRELLATNPEIVFCGLFDRIERVTKAYEEEVARRRLKGASPWQSPIVRTVS